MAADLKRLKSIVAEPAPAPAPAPRTMQAVVDAATAEVKPEAPKLSDIVAAAVKAAIEAGFAKLADDLYNMTAIQHPASFALMRGREVRISAPDANPVDVYENIEAETVLVYTRVVNAAGDVIDVSFGTGGGASAVTEAQAEAPGADGVTLGALLRQGGRLTAAVRAGTYPVSVIATVIKLRGRTMIFGG